MTPKALFDFTDKPVQKAFFFDKSRNVSLFGGYGSGKTYAGCGKLNALMESIPENVGLVGRKTYPALNSTTRATFLDIVRARNGGTLEPGPVIKSFNKAENILYYQNGSVVYFRTLDLVEKIRSLNLGAVLIDQAEEVVDVIYFELNGRIRYWNPERVEAWHKKWDKKLQAELGVIPNPYNQIICVGNPARNWVKKEFHINEKGINSCYQVTTHENKKYLPADYIAQLEARYPQSWIDRFIKGSWNAFGGQIYDEFDYEGVHKVPQFDIPDHWPRIVGWDHGRTNPTSIHAAAIDEMGNVVFYKEHYKPGHPREHVKGFREMAFNDRLPQAESGHYLVHIDMQVKNEMFDQDSNKTVLDYYLDEGINGIKAEKAVHSGILLTQEYMHPDPKRVYPPWHPLAGQLGSPMLFVMDATCPNLVNDWYLYMWEENKEGAEKNSPETPKKVNDHACDSSRYLLMAKNKLQAIAIPRALTTEEIAAKAYADMAAKAFEPDRNPFEEE